jgi:hypothetical protein
MASTLFLTGSAPSLLALLRFPTAEGEPRIGKGLWNGGLPSSFSHSNGYEMWRQIVPSKNLKPIYEIGSGPGYFLHAGQNKGDAVIIKVFNPGPVSEVRKERCATGSVNSSKLPYNCCKHPYSTVDLSKGIMCI